MADEWGEEAARRAKAALIDTTVPNAARVTDYLYGGQNNFAADRKAGRAMAATAPVIAAIAPAVRAFQQRVLRFLVAEAGIRQFLDVGTGLPLVGSTHEVTQSLVPECRIVYVDSDPNSTLADTKSKITAPDSKTPRAGGTRGACHVVAHPQVP